jgi:hypothetical protein
VSLEGAVSRAAFVRDIAARAAAGSKALLLAPLGAGKTHALAAARDALRAKGVSVLFIDLFTAASTPERLLATLSGSLAPLMGAESTAIARIAEEGARDRHLASGALLRLFEIVAARAPAPSLVWLIDEATEIRSLAYFPDLGEVETPFARMIENSRGAILTSSYLGLARDLFPRLESVDLPGLKAPDLSDVPSLRSDGDAIAEAIAATGGFAATLLPLVADMRETRATRRSLVRLLRPGGALELACRRHYEVLLMRSRGYAVSKRAAEVVASSRERRLTDLFPHIGRTAGASRQYLRWLVEVGLLNQIRKRYHFADPLLGLWAGLYLGRADHPTDAEIEGAVDRHPETSWPEEPAGGPDSGPEDEPEPDEPRESPARRPDRFEEFD